VNKDGLLITKSKYLHDVVEDIGTMRSKTSSPITWFNWHSLDNPTVRSRRCVYDWRASVNIRRALASAAHEGEEMQARHPSRSFWSSSRPLACAFARPSHTPDSLRRRQRPHRRIPEESLILLECFRIRGSSGQDYSSGRALRETTRDNYNCIARHGRLTNRRNQTLLWR
jgi:hypothetical protein